jgi:hypothetical protein
MVAHKVILACALVALLLLPDKDARAEEGSRASTAFFYGRDLPPELVEHFDRVVVEPDNLTALPTGGAKLFAYVSLGEVNSHDSAFILRLAPSKHLCDNHDIP